MILICRPLPLDVKALNEPLLIEVRGEGMKIYESHNGELLGFRLSVSPCRVSLSLSYIYI